MPVQAHFRELHGNDHIIEPEYVVFRSVRKQPLQRFDRKKLRTSFLETENRANHRRYLKAKTEMQIFGQLVSYLLPTSRKNNNCKRTLINNYNLIFKTMTKIVKTIAVAILMAMSATMVAQNNESDPGAGSLPPYSVTVTAFAPPPQCSGLYYVTKAIIEVKLLWANDEVFMPYPPEEMNKTIINGEFVFTFGENCSSCAPAYIELCIKGYDDFHYGNGGKLIHSVYKKVTANPPSSGGTHITILSNEWNGKCFGGSLTFPPCP